MTQKEEGSLDDDNEALSAGRQTRKQGTTWTGGDCFGANAERILRSLFDEQIEPLCMMVASQVEAEAHDVSHEPMAAGHDTTSGRQTVSDGSRASPSTSSSRRVFEAAGTVGHGQPQPQPPQQPLDSTTARMYTLTFRKGFWCMVSFATIFQLAVLFAIYVDTEDSLLGNRSTASFQAAPTVINLSVDSFPPPDVRTHADVPRVLSWISPSKHADTTPKSSAPLGQRSRSGSAGGGSVGRYRGPLSTAFLAFVSNLDDWIQRWDISVEEPVRDTESLAESCSDTRLQQTLERARNIVDATAGATLVLDPSPSFDSIVELFATETTLRVVDISSNTPTLHVLDGQGPFQYLTQRAAATLLSDWLHGHPQDNIVLPFPNTDDAAHVQKQHQLQPALRRLKTAVLRQLQQFPTLLKLRGHPQEQQHTHQGTSVQKVQKRELTVSSAERSRLSTLPSLPQQQANVVLSQTTTWTSLGALQLLREPALLSVDKLSGNMAAVYESQLGERVSWHVWFHSHVCTTRLRFPGSARVTSLKITGTRLVYSRFNDHVKFRVTAPISELCTLQQDSILLADIQGPVVVSPWFLSSSVVAWDTDPNTTTVVLSSVAPWAEQKQANWFIDLYHVGLQCVTVPEGQCPVAPHVFEEYCSRDARCRRGYRSVVSLSMVPWATDRGRSMSTSTQALVAFLTGGVPRVSQATLLREAAPRFYRIVVDDKTFATFDLYCDAASTSCEPSSLVPIIPFESTLGGGRRLAETAPPPPPSSQQTTSHHDEHRGIYFPTSIGSSGTITSLLDGSRVFIFHRDEEQSPIYRLTLQLESVTKVLGPAAAVASLAPNSLRQAISHLLNSTTLGTSADPMHESSFLDEVMGTQRVYTVVLFRRGDLILVDIPLSRKLLQEPFLERSIAWATTLWTTSSADGRLVTIQLGVCLVILLCDRFLRRHCVRRVSS